MPTVVFIQIKQVIGSQITNIFSFSDLILPPPRLTLRAHLNTARRVPSTARKAITAQQVRATLQARRRTALNLRPSAKSLLATARAHRHTLQHRRLTGE